MAEKTKHTDAVKWDMTRVDIFDVQDLVEAQAATNFRGIAAILAKACVKCPTEWGEPDDPNSFRRPIRGEWTFKDVVGSFLEAANESGE
jgi:hypothetical protein